MESCKERLSNTRLPQQKAGMNPLRVGAKPAEEKNIRRQSGHATAGVLSGHSPCTLRLYLPVTFRLQNPGVNYHSGNDTAISILILSVHVLPYDKQTYCPPVRHSGTFFTLPLICFNKLEN